MLITMKEIHYVSADEAVKAIKSGDQIHLSSVASVPTTSSMRIDTTP